MYVFNVGLIVPIFVLFMRRIDTFNGYRIGVLPQTPVTFLSWHQKVTKKSQDFARFTQKTCVWRLKSSKLLPSVVKQGGFRRRLHLFFGSPDEVSHDQPFSRLYNLFLYRNNQIKCITGNYSPGIDNWSNNGIELTKKRNKFWKSKSVW